MTLPFTDHHIQDTILYELTQSERRFSELLPDGMEHSAFMYHMRKLLKQGIVEKHDDYYRLTQTGAQLYNARYQLKSPLRRHRALVQFVVVRGDDLLINRRKSHLGEYLNRIMLPGGAHFFLSSSRQSAVVTAKERGLQLGEFLSSVETIAKQNNFHGLIDIYAAEQVTTLPDNPHTDYELAWMPIADVAAMNFSEAGTASFIAKRLAEGRPLEPRETFYT